MEEYSLYLTQFPETWEINAVNKVCKAAKNREVKIHFTNISSSKAVINLNQYSKNFTCDTSVPYLYYH